MITAYENSLCGAHTIHDIARHAGERACGGDTSLVEVPLRDGVCVSVGRVDMHIHWHPGDQKRRDR